MAGPLHPCCGVRPRRPLRDSSSGLLQFSQGAEARIRDWRGRFEFSDFWSETVSIVFCLDLRACRDEREIIERSTTP